MIKGKSVYLRALTEEDMTSIYRACQDEEMVCQHFFEQKL